MVRKISIIAFITVLFASCTKDFQSINTNPNVPTAVPNDYLLATSQVQLAGAHNPDSKSWRNNFGYSACLVQQMSSTDISFYGGSFYTSTQNSFSAYFEDAYPNSIKNEVNLISLSSADAKFVNITSMARILKVMDIAVMTDMYGDVPYSGAGKGYLDANFTPAYDAQKDIYSDLLSELEKAGAAFDATAYIPVKADYIYSGDLAKWKRAANTLMLRLAMRLVKVDPAMAQAWAAKAIAGGLITSSAENIAIKFDGVAQISSNPNSWILGPTGSRNIAAINGVSWGKTLIDMMKNRQDPRLPLIAALKNGDNTVAKQAGLPNGTNTNTLATLTPSNLDLYSRPAAAMYQNSNPWIYMTYAEARLLQAEAIERGYATGAAATVFADGQVSALNQVYGAVKPSAGDIATYAAANTYPALSTLDAKMNAIHTELYLLNAVTLNGAEAWSDWRRSGYPVLTPVNFVGNETNGVIPRRLKYSPGEFGVNPNVNAAIAKQGADLFTTRVWWDK
ncbi:SusD/RagB family nutrient-binding outer membrane lipoprotein [Mucilaginibacter sp. ZT4R22]|uniref:SusD/RagB family nutrient-binding outer membrane lipoprotein n=1 Tax=Mucilaginibacter pankratovii TaxID=2772110 RepID=A0ABR7WNP3_9SPHI|nr:SusD/RagB family nutrient-binding outer membrane lipoprotein [Mucilaginibacter pankratovii]MBD1363768.1 SusD/RagB family nutrient-binding outer membrane lipoprotein [Mucilaginibacter pankratovii]